MKSIKKRFTTVLLLFFVLVYNLTTYFYTFSEYVSKLDTNKTGINSNIVTINDLDSDYNYYMGLNYVSSDGTLPTLENKNLYNEKNLVELKITYFGKDVLNENIGYVSLSENQDTFIYYKLYPVNNNGTTDTNDDYVEIELIDNPFSDRPNDKGFNGWTTDYKNATIILDNDYYVRYAQIPVTYTDGIPDAIDIDFYSNWINAKVSFVNANNNWSSAFSTLSKGGMQPIGGQAPVYESVEGLYVQYNIAWRQDYPNGAVNNNGSNLNGRCNNYYGGCDYYLQVDDSTYNESLTYYQLTGNGNNRRMNEYEVEIIGYEELSKLEEGTILSGYFKQVDLTNKNTEGYYSELGYIQSNNICRTNCTYYELINYYDEEGNINKADGETLYYYLATRDTNIVVMNQSLNTKWTDTENKPFTLTSVHNDVSYIANVTWDISSQYIIAHADTRIENIKINSSAGNSNGNPTNSATYNRYIYGNYYNLKIGRGITQSDSYKTFNGVIGGNNNTSAIGSADEVIKYKLIVESGWYNNITLTNGPATTNRDKYIEAKGVYGNDYDRITTNDNLDVYFVTAGSWGAGNYYASTNEGITFDAVIKSGKFGSGKYDHTTGVYIGGRSYGTHYTSRRVKVEGGWIYNLIGGPMTASNRASINDTYVYMTGGSVDMIIGGAGTSTTYGNRILSITGGTVNYSVFGGSNSYSGGSTDGKLTGSSYVYIGGNATIGNSEYVNNNSTLWGAEAGSVFGIGNGNTTSSSIGSNENSNIIIDGDCTILGNVYGGGNYSATGISSTKSTTTTNIKILNGTINGSVYGGGNNNGSGSTAIPSTVNIDITGGTFNGSVYGGSKTLGTINGSIKLNVLGGIFNNSIFGGGQGNETIVSNNIDIVVGNNTTVNKNIYGGSEFGTVNSSTNNQTNITINKGNILGSIFGGAQGDDTYSPSVLGNVKVTINDGEINNVFGANDISGTLSGKTEIYLKGGNINNVYGGGNKTSQPITNVYLQGSTVGNIFGGSNESGNVDTSNITITSGKATNVFGGNNIAGLTSISQINLNGGEIDTVYGGGNKTSHTTSNINLNGSLVKTIFGGSNESGEVTDSNITTTKGDVTTIYGGNHQGGKTITSNIKIDSGNVDTIYGGGKLADTNTTNVIINNSLNAVYGGGEEANATTTYITTNNGTIIDIFGGSNKSGEVNESNIKINKGNITNIYGGNNTGGITNTSNLNIAGATITTIYGGGNNAETKETIINVNNGTIENVYGGGNDTNGITDITNLNLKNGVITNVYGGGNKALTTTSNINLNGSTIENVFGGGNEAGITTANVNLYSGNIENIFGGSNNSGNVSNSNINTYESTEIPEEPEVEQPEIEKPEDTQALDMSLSYSAVAVNPYWQDTNYSSVATIDVTITNNTNEIISEYDGYINLSDSTLYSNYSSTELVESNGKYTFTEVSVHDSSNPNTIEAGESYTFQFTLYSKLNPDEFEITEYGISTDSIIDTPDEEETKEDEIIEDNEITELNVDNLYGGNNKGGITDNSVINLNKGTYGNIYGGGNQAVLNKTSIILDNIIVNERVYGGGNQALVTDNTNLKIINSIIKGSVFGGGNAGPVSKNTYVYISDSNIFESVYGGGNGSTAIIQGNTNIDIEGNTNVTKHVFGGGNAANTGLEALNNSKTLLNIISANIGGNVYGGGNTSVVYGTTNVNIGNDVVTNTNLTKGNIIIGGTVFGGGEANEQGSENYDYSFISVTEGTTINIDGNNHDELTIKGSIFGSGNASSTEGYSYINISNYGDETNYKNNISIQRADLVEINNSVIELMGTTDRTNEYSTVLFSLSRIKHLKLKNNSILYLSNGANLLEEYSSVLDNGEEVLEIVTFENNQVIKNVDNKIFIKGGKNLNIATNENATAYGKVNGMTFFGLYTKDRNNNMLTGLYGDYNIGDTVSNNELYLFDAGSYVLGIHKDNHDTTKDGFYSNFEKDGIVSIEYIKPTPEKSTYYMWSIGEQVVTIEISLTASKYLTLGTKELGLLNYSDPNTTFSIVGFNYNNLAPNVSLVKEEEVPRIANSSDEADNTMSLVMKSTNSGWITKGETTFLTSGTGIDGTTFYKSENSTEVPNLQFYLYHSKNLGTDGKMGSVTISLVVSTPIDDISNNVQRVNIIVNLDRKLYNTNDYEASMTIGKEYDLFASTNVNLTADGSFSAYYSLFVEGNAYKDGYHRSLISTYAFPVNTKITLINRNERNVNEYYYFVVTEDNYNDKIKELNENKECSYDLSEFIRMGSTSISNNYDDALNNIKYYKDGISFEEFIVIVDFADSNITENVLEKSLLIELKNKDDETVVSVLGIEQEQMVYSLYTNSDAIVEVEGLLSKEKVYPGDSVNLNVTTNFNRKIVDSKIVYDTNYFDQQLGFKITYLDSNGNQVTGASLLGMTYVYEGVTYYPRMDGSVRIRLAEKMANVSANITINTTENVAAGNYTMVIESFGSPDGIYYGDVSSDMDTLNINVLDTVYGLNLSMGDYTVLIDKDGNNLNENNDLRFNLKYSSGLSNPKIRMSLYRRNYDSIYSTDYEIVDLQEYVNEDLTTTNKQYEYLLTDTPLSDISYKYTFKDDLKTGTYKFVISLYDNNTYIGDVYKYIIIKERYNE